MLKGIELSNFCDRVDALVEKHYGDKDGGDLCFNLVEAEVIDPSRGEDEAARIVAQHIQQA